MRNKENGTSRLHLLDSIRGINLFSMIIYHAMWNLVFMYGVSIPFYTGTIGYIWQQSICWIFIILSGFCWSFGKAPLKRGLIVFGGGAIITAVTVVVMPQNLIVFGVLTLLGSCMLIMIPLEKLLKKIPAGLGAVLSFCLFVFTKNCNDGYLGFESFNIVKLPTVLFANYFTAFLGFPQKSFYSTDYFSLIPWLFLFIFGYFLFRIFNKANLNKRLFSRGKIPIFAFFGKHSLIIYMLHQPILFCFCEILNALKII